MPDYISALDLFTIGIGPSSSHTVGPMRAALLFAQALDTSALLPQVDRLQIELYGSLGATGPGHGTSNAIFAGLAGSAPETCEPELVGTAWQRAVEQKSFSLLGRSVSFDLDDFKFLGRQTLPRHSNAIKFFALSASGEELFAQTYYSVGGGFVEADHQIEKPARGAVPFAFDSAVELLEHATAQNASIAEIAWQNEVALHGDEEYVSGRLKAIWAAMSSCINTGLATRGTLPGYLQVPRRAADMAAALSAQSLEDKSELANQWLQAYAFAVNEQNAAGARVVTAPTNGAAGIIPAVAFYARQFRGVGDSKIAKDFLLTAAAIGSLYKRNASISGAEAGCQGEVGSACSMAAGALAAVLGGTPTQIENAAEIAMEHNLGLTCDPVGGFVQMPCIERNAIAAGTALSAVRLALLGDGSHKISLDTVIETMRQTGIDMSTKYKETSLGGLAVNVVEC
jgi:L-serine dehydratase